jgi:hypothetical protein
MTYSQDIANLLLDMVDSILGFQVTVLLAHKSGR